MSTICFKSANCFVFFYVTWQTWQNIKKGLSETCFFFVSLTGLFKTSALWRKNIRNPPNMINQFVLASNWLSCLHVQIKKNKNTGIKKDCSQLQVHQHEWKVKISVSGDLTADVNISKRWSENYSVGESDF